MSNMYVEYPSFYELDLYFNLKKYIQRNHNIADSTPCPAYNNMYESNFTYTLYPINTEPTVDFSLS